MYDTRLTISENFKNLTPEQVFSKFNPYCDAETIIASGVTCHRLCPSDNSDEMVQNTLLVSCNYAKLIKSIVICDKDLNKIKTIDLSRPTRMLTINMPKIGDDVVQIKPNNTCCGNCNHHPPFVNHHFQD